MLSKNFNKIGGTEYRVGNQILGYTYLAQFLLEEFIDERKINIDVLDKKFKEFCIREQIYKYKNDQKIKNRISMVLKLFKQLNLVEIFNKEVSIRKKDIERLLENPSKNFFDLFNNKFIFFKEALLFSKKSSKKIDPQILSTAILIYDNENDVFSNIYNNLSNNCNDVLEQLVFNLLKTKELKDIAPESFEESFKKPNKNNIYVTNVLKKMKENEILNEEDIFNLLECKTINKYFFKLKSNIFFKNEKNIRFNQKTKRIFLKKYFNESKYEEFMLDVHKCKIWSIIGEEYNDLIYRWVNNFNLIDNKFINKKAISIFDENNITYSSVIEKICDYPYSLNNIEKWLKEIQNNKFLFKFNDENLLNITNSTLAEYFVNLYIAQKYKIPPESFKKFSRTILQPNSLLPLNHAPGKGPDMYLLNNNQLIIVETTIHNTIKQIKNNEIFNVIEHVELDKISYISNSEKTNLNTTKIILVTNLKNNEDCIEVEKDLIYNHKNNDKNCGNNRFSKVTNFEKIMQIEII